MEEIKDEKNKYDIIVNKKRSQQDQKILEANKKT